MLAEETRKRKSPEAPDPKAKQQKLNEGGDGKGGDDLKTKPKEKDEKETHEVSRRNCAPTHYCECKNSIMRLLNSFCFWRLPPLHPKTIPPVRTNLRLSRSLLHRHHRRLQLQLRLLLPLLLRVLVLCHHRRHQHCLNLE